MFTGAFTALITPFSSSGEVDEKALRRLIKWQISEGIHGLVSVGTTGESPTLSHDEHRRVIEITLEESNGQVPIIAGAGSNSTREAIELARFAALAGADAILVVTPYYNKPNQQGLYAHFAALAEAVDIPIFIYNIPSRSVIDMTPQTLGELKRNFRNIIGVKDATGRVERVNEQRMQCGSEFIQLSGEDASALGFNAHGGSGCISVTANIAPKLCTEMQKACLNNNYQQANELHNRLMPLHKALFIEPNPAGVKYAAEKLGLCQSYLRLPLVNINEVTKKIIDEAIIYAGLNPL